MLVEYTACQYVILKIRNYFIKIQKRITFKLDLLLKLLLSYFYCEFPLHMIRSCLTLRYNLKVNWLFIYWHIIKHIFQVLNIQKLYCGFILISVLRPYENGNVFLSNFKLLIKRNSNGKTNLFYFKLEIFAFSLKVKSIYLIFTFLVIMSSCHLFWNSI